MSKSRLNDFSENKKFYKIFQKIRKSFSKIEKKSIFSIFYTKTPNKFWGFFSNYFEKRFFFKNSSNKLFGSLKFQNSVKFDTELREQLVTELKEMCTRAFTLVTDRFPHIKSFYRLAQLHFEKGEFDEASEHIFKNTFKRKKRDDGMFDNCVEISCNDINRNGSFGFHIERCAKLGAQVAQKTMDLYNVVAMLNTMINIIAKDDE